MRRAGQVTKSMGSPAEDYPSADDWGLSAEWREKSVEEEGMSVDRGVEMLLWEACQHAWGTGRRGGGLPEDGSEGWWKTEKSHVAISESCARMTTPFPCQPNARP